MVFAKGQLLLALAAVAVVNAQNPTSTAGLSACLLGCVSAAATDAGCSSYTDIKCVCTSTKFQTNAQACLSKNCTSADETAALQMQQQECATLSTGSGTSTASSSAATNGTSKTSTSTSTSTNANSTSSSTSGTKTSTGVTATGTSSGQQMQHALGVVGAVVAGVLGLVL